MVGSSSSAARAGTGTIRALTRSRSRSSRERFMSDLVAWAARPCLAFQKQTTGRAAHATSAICQLCPKRLVLPQERLALGGREGFGVLAEGVAVVARVIEELEQLVIGVDALGVLLQVVDVAGADPWPQQPEAFLDGAVFH